VNKPGGVYLDGIILKATVTTEKLDLPVHPLVGADASAAKTGFRSAYWPEYRERRDTPVYSFAALKPGNAVAGPAIAEMEYSTIVIPPGQQLEIDSHGLGILKNAGTEG
jgi:N-methylhydantoinase A/oxoprolinase/acetone carboxylase beta subunit